MVVKKFTVNDDGVIIHQMAVEQSHLQKPLVQLSKSQDDEIGDGTTGVVGNVVQICGARKNNVL